MIPFPPDLPDDQLEPWQQAVELFHQAYRLQREGDLAGAIHAYSRSTRLYPTAEAHTSLGWVYSVLHLYDDAMACCRAAIALDPTFGNAYNDLGAYLIEQGKAAEAIPLLQQALDAPRATYGANPLFNMGRAYEHTGQWIHAVEYYTQAARLDPGHRDARDARDRLRSKLN
jgi:tetratricopeptide (TPR) repeat protein